MAVKIQYVRDGTGVEFIASGVVTDEQIMAANTKAYAGVSLTRQRYQLVDFSGADRFDVTPNAAMVCAEQDKKAAEVNPDIVIAVVAPDDLAFGTSRLWEAHVHDSSFRTHVFRDRASAEAWLEQTLATTAGRPGAASEDERTTGTAPPDS